MAMNAIKNLQSQVTRNNSTEVARATAESVAESTANSAITSALTSAQLSSLTRNLNKKNVGSVTISDTGLRMSTAGDFAIAGLLYNKAASSAVWTLAGTTLSASQITKFLLALDASGNGVARQWNITTAEVSCSLPSLSAATCPIGMITITNGSVSFVPGTTTFSQVIQNGGSVVIKDIVGMI